ncbi:MerR family transcriptional regulator [Paraburkholderia sp. J12]|uniref:MerR family transcriptional regulator n=1 Tax=Paraburkholderia sp. J12 TaxID=2805432 RepID=UPI002ABE8121|nr:MerR family transcriptional regulator [Paraburkholderia sp. J12]
MQISELARRAGISVHTIRHYESLGLIEATRRPSGYREFDDSMIRELRFVVMSRQTGFSLKRIAEVLPAYRTGSLTIEQMIAMLEDRIAEVDAEIAKRHTLRKRLVAHIDWFLERQKRAANKQGVSVTKTGSRLAFASALMTSAGVTIASTQAVFMVLSSPA